MDADCACKASARENSGRHPARGFIAGVSMVMFGSLVTVLVLAIALPIGSEIAAYRESRVGRIL